MTSPDFEAAVRWFMRESWEAAKREQIALGARRADLLKALRWAGDEFGMVRQPNPGQPGTRDEAPNVVTLPGLAPRGNRHERRAAAALARRKA